MKIPSRRERIQVYTRQLRLIEQLIHTVRTLPWFERMVAHIEYDGATILFLNPPGPAFTVYREKDRIWIRDDTLFRSAPDEFHSASYEILPSKCSDEMMVEDLLYLISSKVKAARKRNAVHWEVIRIQIDAEDGVLTDDLDDERD